LPSIESTVIVIKGPKRQNEFRVRWVRLTENYELVELRVDNDNSTFKKGIFEKGVQKALDLGFVKVV
jgi:hypothetical protein